MKGKGVLIAVLVVLLAVLLLQNSGLVQVRLYFWSLYIPMFILVLGVFLVGLAVGFLLAKIEKGKGMKHGLPLKPEPPASSPSADL
jgi:uncharacterized integral membrane protein